jgi:hypothetical protein
MLTLRLCRPDLRDAITDDAAAFAAKSLDNNLPAFLKLSCISHTQICRLTNITPRIFSEHLLLCWRTSGKIARCLHDA